MRTLGFSKILLGGGLLKRKSQSSKRLVLGIMKKSRSFIPKPGLLRLVFDPGGSEGCSSRAHNCPLADDRLCSSDTAAALGHMMVALSGTQLGNLHVPAPTAWNICTFAAAAGILGALVKLHTLGVWLGDKSNRDLLVPTARIITLVDNFTVVRMGSSSIFLEGFTVAPRGLPLLRRGQKLFQKAWPAAAASACKAKVAPN